MSVPQAERESPAVLLVFGLVTIAGLFFISILTLGAPVVLGLAVGAIELVVAWRTAPPVGARSVRVITALFGAVTVGWALVRLVVS
ncbi:MAG: hypothetical protein ACXVWV_07690 [Nocardioides sp.]